MSNTPKYLITKIIESKFHTRADRADIRVKICMAVPVRKETLYRWENATADNQKCEIGAYKLQKVANVLDVSIESLLQPVIKPKQ